MKLYPHQEVGAEWLASKRNALLFDEQGLGKTITAISAAHRIEYTGNASHVLVLCPAVVLFNWAKEFSKWSPDRHVQIIRTGKDGVYMDGERSQVVIVSHTLFHVANIYHQLLAWNWDVLIVDELHNFRNESAKRTQALYGPTSRLSELPEDLRADAGNLSLVAACDRVWGLTGTPMPNNASEIWTHLRFLFPEQTTGIFDRPMSFSEFRARYCLMRHTRYGLKIIGNKQHNVGELRDRIRAVSLRRKKADVLKDLPAIRYETVAVEPKSLPAEFFDLNNSVKAKMADDGVDSATFLIALKNSTEYAEYRRWCGLAKVDAVVELLKAELETGALEKVVVFAHHTDVVRAIQDGLIDFGALSITGMTLAKTRDTYVEAFQAEPEFRVMVCNIVAGGVGITLTAASDVVFAEMSFVPGENAQAADRCHRIGQTERVRVRCLAMANTVDEDVMDALTNKTRMIREVTPS